MNDILSNLQSLIQDRILSHADLTALEIFSESTGNLEEQIEGAVQTKGVCAVIFIAGMSPSDAFPGHYEIEFAIEVHEDRETNLDADNSDALGIPCAQVVEKICFEQLTGWAPDAILQSVRNIGFKTIEVVPHNIKEITASTYLYDPQY